MIAYDRSGSVIVLADGAELLVHDGPSEGPLWRRDCGSPLVALGAAAGAVIAVDRNGRARWFDARRDNIQATVEAGVPARAAAVSPSGDVLLVADGEARVLTRAGPGLVIPWPGARLVAWADDGRMLVADDAGKVGELDARGEFLRGVKLDPPVVAAAWNPQGFWVLASGARAIRWDHEGMTHLTGSPDDEAITDVACASDGKRIALTVRDGLVIALFWPSRDTAGSLEYPERKVDGLAFGPPTLLAVGLDGGDGNKVDFQARAVNRTDTHPGRPHRRWLVKVGISPPEEPAAPPPPAARPAAPAEPAPRPAYAPPREPAAPANSPIGKIVAVVILLVVALYAFVRMS